MSSRDSILARLRSRQKPFPHVTPPDEYQPMTPLETDPDSLLKRFLEEAEELATVTHQPADEPAAIRTILDILEDDKNILAWDWPAIPLPGLKAALDEAHIAVSEPDDPAPRVGISGAEAALAATGSLVLLSGAGKYRATSLLPPVHIAVITRDQILPDLENWVAWQRVNDLPAFNLVSNIAIISGPSRTADIAMESILGMHGPGDVHVVIMAGRRIR